MRVLKVVQAYEPFREMGGAVVKVRAIAEGLAERGHEVTIATANLGLERFSAGGAVTSSPYAPSRWGQEATLNRVRTVYFPTRARYRALTFNPAVRSFARKRLSAFDVVHIYGMYDLLGPVVAATCRRTAKPYVIEPMGMFRPIVRSILLKRLYHWTLGKEMVRGSRLLIATSVWERAEIMGADVAADRIVIRRNGITFPACLPPTGSFRARWNIRGDARVVLFLGRVVSKKSPDLLLESFAAWRRESPNGAAGVLIIAGPEEGDGYSHKLRSLAARLEISESTRFTGALYDDEKWAAYRDADLFVLPSQDENFGNSAGEALAAGVPVILTDRCGIAPFIQDRAGLVIPHSREKLTAALAAMLDHPPFRAKFAAGCAEAARSLSWDKPLAEMEAIYLRLISHGASA